jgi:hypothetical protein
MFKMYRDWEELFGKNIIIDRKNWRRNRTVEEDEYCKTLCLNSNVLREVKLTAADIINRLNKLNLVNHTGTSIFEKILHFNFEEENKNILFKLIIAGGFYPRFVKCQNTLDFEKIKKRNKNSDMKKSIIVKR